MPVWHETTRRWVKEGRLALVGVIQEQHAERCRLFAQWRQFDWPILHDPINVLEATGVPIAIAIDEHGIVRSTGPRPESFEADFLNRQFADDAQGDQAIAKSLTPPRDTARLAEAARRSNTAADWRAWGDSLAIWHAPERVNEAIQAYERALTLDADDLSSHFRLGVCLRMRHETSGRQPDDFSRAIAAWESALGGNPNQYIWRRRIQQYGPRLIKPYPFYDWVAQAQSEIRRRGETPVALPVQPSGAEVAHPNREFTAADGEAVSPDPKGVIFRDTEELIRATVTVVPTEVEPGSTCRVHVSLIPDAKRRAHWNNEAEPLRLWIETPPRASVAEQLLETPAVESVVSSEVRRLDFEVKVPADADQSVEVSAFALYYVCEDVDGTCLFLRKDISIEIPIAGP